LLLQVVIVGQLPIEGECEPLGLAPVVALEGLRVAPIVAATGGVADMADGGRAVHFAEDRLELLAMVQPEGLGYRPDFLVRLEQRLAVGTITGHPGCELAPVLDVEQHAWDQPCHAVDPARWRGQSRDRTPRGVVDSSRAAFMV